MSPLCPDPLPLYELTEALTQSHERGEEETPAYCGIERLSKKASGGGDGGGYKEKKGHGERKRKKRKGSMHPGVITG